MTNNYRLHKLIVSFSSSTDFRIDSEALLMMLRECTCDSDQMKLGTQAETLLQLDGHE